MSGLLTLSAIADMPKTIILLLVIIACVAIYLVGHLLNSYPLVIVASLVTIGLSIFSFVDSNYMLGVCWLIFSILATIFAFLHFYKNVRFAFWWTLGALIALIASAVPFDSVANVEEETANLLTFVVPTIVFLLFGIIGGTLAPRLRFRDKNERNHLTNADPIIGQRVRIVEEKSGEFPARAALGDIDWSIEPFYAYESFKVGDIVKVVKIKGVTLLCTRDQKDYRAELKKQRREQEASRKLKEQELAAKREAIKASKKIEKQKEKLAKEKEKFEKEQALMKAKEAHLEAKQKQKEALNKAKEETKAMKNASKEARKSSKPEKESKTKIVSRETKKRSFKKFYIVSSVIAIILSIIIIIIAFVFPSLFSLARSVYLGLIFIYLIAILVCESIRAKRKETKKPEKKVEEPKVVEVKKVEEPKVVEVKKEEIKVVVEETAKEKADFVPFAVRLKKADKELKDAYNELKSEVLSYGIKSRVSSTGDSFRLHTKTYVKMVIAGKCLKLYLALNPRDYRDTTYPFVDASKMSAHKETPFVFKIKSGLSVRRAKVLIGDAAKKDGLVQGEVIAYNHAKDVK